MTKHPITNYLEDENKMFGNLLTKLNQLKQWNGWLNECLPLEKNPD